MDPPGKGAALGAGDGDQVLCESMSSFGLNFGGLLQSMSDFRSKPFQPVFEAISNGLHAVEDLGRNEQGGLSQGKIYIIIERDTTQLTLDLEGARLPIMPIKAIKIKDSGIGFNEKNYTSFKELFSRHKYSRGGKGIGRLAYLKVFSEFQVESIFLDGDSNTFKQRRFRCSVEEGVAGDIVLPTDETKVGTTVTLRYPKQEYIDVLRRSTDTIARAIMEHFLIFFSSPDAPSSIYLFDESSDGEEQRNLNDEFNAEMLTGISEQEINISGNNLSIRYLSAKRAPGNTNKVYLCANGREVTGRNLASFIDNLPKQGGIGEGDEKTYILVCVAGQYLDEHVNYSRVGFDIPLRSESEDELGFGTVSIEGIFQAVGEKAADHLRPLTETLAKKTRESLRDYVLQDRRRSAKFRPLLDDQRYEHILKKIELPPVPKARDFELALVQAKNLLEVDIMSNTEELYSRRPGNKGITLEELRKRHNEIVGSIDLLKQMDLIDYVIHRKVILEFLEKSLEWSQDQAEVHYVEEAIHRIFHPLNTESSQVHPEFQNLWVIDERLMYHSYLASDRRLAANRHTSSEDGREPDLYLTFDPNYFDNPHAYRADKDSPSIVIVEFKRPGRESYTYADPKSDPIEQTIKYVQDIRQGKTKSQSGRVIANATNIQYYAYIIIDFTEDANQLLNNYVERVGFRRDFSGTRYFGYYPAFNLYVEAIDFTRLIDDAKSRSQYIFERLGIDESKML